MWMRGYRASGGEVAVRRRRAAQLVPNHTASGRIRVAGLRSWVLYFAFLLSSSGLRRRVSPSRGARSHCIPEGRWAPQHPDDASDHAAGSGLRPRAFWRRKTGARQARRREVPVRPVSAAGRCFFASRLSSCGSDAARVLLAGDSAFAEPRRRRGAPGLADDESGRAGGSGRLPRAAERTAAVRRIRRQKESALYFVLPPSCVGFEPAPLPVAPENWLAVFPGRPPGVPDCGRCVAARRDVR